MKAIKTKISITIDKDILESGREVSKKYRRSLSQFTNVILKHYIKSKANGAIIDDEIMENIKPSEESKARVSLTIDVDAVELLKRECERFDRPLSQLINVVLEDYLNEKMENEEVRRLLIGK